MTTPPTDRIDALYADYFEDDDEGGRKAGTENSQHTEPTTTPAVGEERVIHRRASRFRLTEDDLRIFDFLETARYAPYAQFASLLACTENAARNRANRLVKFGYLERRREPRFPTLYFLSARGRDEVGSDHGLVNRDFGAGLIAHTLRVNELLIKVLNTPNAPMLISERELQHAVFVESYLRDGDSNQQHAWTSMRFEKQRAVRNFREGKSGPREFEPDSEWMWAIFEGVEQDYHFPDLVIATSRRGDGAPTAQAVEVELSRKKPREVMRVLRCYKREFETGGVYGKVVWFAGSPAVARLILRCAQAPTVDFPKDRLEVRVIGQN